MPTVTVARETSTYEVAAAAHRAWRVFGEEARVCTAQELSGICSESICSVVLVPRLHRLECIFDRHAKIEDAVDYLSASVRDGWDVSALLPVGLLGEAHETFRGLHMKLQGWWTNPEGSLKFTAAETP